MKLNLTDSEWVSVVDSEADGLPYCCANVSALRDALIDILRTGRETNFLNEQSLIRGLVWAYDSHDLDQIPVMKKILDQVKADPDLGPNYEKVHSDVRQREL